MSSGNWWRWSRVSFRRLSTLLFLFAVLSGCRKEAAGPPPRYMVVRFENLSGDPTLEWISRAASEFLSRSLSGALNGPVVPRSDLGRVEGTFGVRPASAPGISSERSAALIAGATRVITGYVERAGGRLRIAAIEEDAASGKTTRVLAAEDTDPLKALDRLAHAFSPAAKPYLTSSAAALRLYSTSIESSPQDAQGLLEQSIAADADFGPAWLMLVNLNIVRENRATAEELIEKARRRKLDRLDLAELDLDSAGLRGDRDGRILALREISDLTPGDSLLLRTLTEAETAAGQFGGAAADWKKLTALNPNDVDAWNQLGYSRAWAGDYRGALEALKEYARLRPNDPNVSDSTGDVYYMQGKFPEAAASYQQANARDPKFQQGGELLKAAWAKFKAGDKAGADAAFEQFRAAREKAKSLDLPLFQADWLHRTGRHKEAMALLRKDGQGPGAAAQLTIWDLLDKDRAAAEKDAAAVGQVNSPLFFAARFAALPSASAEEWGLRAERMINGTGAAGFREIALGYALLLDGKKEAALPVWRKIAETTPATDFFSRAIYARLRGERPKLELTPDPSVVNPFGAVLDSL
ncbi:MAG: tetratricopeptide repeat protein [Bryobacteraceae bacterium]|jgi:tetratricopeptide (TPR) repeat protein